MDLDHTWITSASLSSEVMWYVTRMMSNLPDEEAPSVCAVPESPAGEGGDMDYNGGTLLVRTPLR